MIIEGSNIIVTGGSSGTGKATARLLTEKGAQVLITGRDAKRLAAAAKEIGCQWLEADVSNPADIERTFEWVKNSCFNRLDVLINNAGIGEFAPVAETPMECYERVMAVNFFGPVMMVKKALPLMLQRGGSIVNVASTSSQKGFASGSAYSASKFALRGFTQSLMEEVRSQNIRVFQVNPSEVSTALGNPERKERKETNNKLGPGQLAQTIVSILELPDKAFIPLAQTIVSILELPDKAFIPELSVWATNPGF
jgi:3-oxoacyl-[acyl-carrier protein] reductase